jgi:hypothetical protein
MEPHAGANDPIPAIILDHNMIPSNLTNNALIPPVIAGFAK